MPADILSLTQLHTLELQHITFIEDDFKSSTSDVVFRVDTLKGEKAYLYFLIEPQRKAEKLMPFKLHKYAVRLMDLHQRKYKSETLPLEARDELWEEFQDTLQPILGDNYMMSIADALRQEGMQQGMQTEAIQIAKNLLSDGLEINRVAKNTGLDIEFVQKLSEETTH